jgi:hypothetical protein
MNDGCLGWDCSVLTQAGYRGKNGLLLPSQNPNGSQWRVNTFAGLFKGQLPVVVLINSDPGANVYSGLIPTALAAASVPHP